MSQSNVEVSEIHWLMDMFQTVDVGLVVLSADYRIQVWNGFMENHSGLTPRQVRDRYLFDLFSEIDEEWLRRKCDPVILLKNRAFTIWEQRPYIFKFRNYRPITGSADYMYQNSTIFPITDVRGVVSHLCMIIYDVTDVATSRLELESMNGQLRQLSKTDFLTALNNRGHWEDSLMIEFKRLKRSGHRSALLMCDIDHFKRVNDTYGHAAGDAVIKAVAQAVKKNLRETDVAGRYGGEEFILLFPETSMEDLSVPLNSIREKIKRIPFKFKDTNVPITISFGATQLRSADTNREAFDRADEALYEAKRNGRDKVIFKK